MSDVVPQPKVDHPPEKRSDAKPIRSRTFRLAGVGLIVISVLLAWFLLVGFLGWQSGQRLLIERQEAELIDALTRQVNLAESDIAQENYALALRRLTWVLERDPGYAKALTLKAEAEAGLNVLVTPTAVPLLTTTPTPPPLPTATPGLITSPSDEFQRIRRLVATKTWPEALSALLAFQIQFPNYERQETDQMLYDVYINYGIDLVTGEQVELGMYYLAQAKRLGDLPQYVEDHITWAELFTQGQSFYGVNWGAAAYYYRDLCLAAPFYHDSCAKLYDVLVNYADQYATAQDWCPAQLLYEEASQHQTTATLFTKLEQAREGCLQATPTSTAPITDTVPISDTLPSIGSPFVLPTPTSSVP
jgi:hypothetical protein